VRKEVRSGSGRVVDKLGRMLTSKYGVSEDVVRDVRDIEWTNIKVEERRNIKNRYIIMLKRIILGKARAEDFDKEANKNDFYSNSIISNFLSDMLLR
jgi:hypothetical protein